MWIRSSGAAEPGTVAASLEYKVRRLSSLCLCRVAAAAIAISLVAAGCSSGSGRATPKAAPQLATATGPGVHGPVNAAIDDRATVGVARLLPATRVWRLKSVNAVDGRVTVRLPLLRPPRPNESVVGLTAERPSGPWTPQRDDRSERPNRFTDDHPF
jgi:hypothetical protein